MAPPDLFYNNFVLVYAGCIVDATEVELLKGGASVRTITAWIRGNKIASDLIQSGEGSSLEPLFNLSIGRREFGDALVAENGLHERPTMSPNFV